MSVFAKVKDFALDKGYALLCKKGAKCPECGDRLELPAVRPEDGDGLQCAACGWVGGVFDLMGGVEPEEISEQPSRSKIQRREDVGSVSWLIPASKRPNFLWFFALVWLGITSVVTFGVLFGNSNTETSSGEAVGFGVFLLLFWSIGLVIGYFGVRMSFMESLVVVDSENVVLIQKCFGKVKRKSALCSDVKRVELREAYKQNERPVYEVAVAGESGKLFGFGVRLHEDEKRWMLGQLRASLELRKSREISQKSVAGYGGSMVLQSGADLKEINEPGLSLVRVGEQGFRVVREYRCAIWLYLGAVLASVVSCVFLYNGFNEWKEVSTEGSKVSMLFSTLFTLFPLLGGGVALCVGMGLVIAGRHYQGRVQSFEFDGDSVRVRAGKKSERGKDTLYQRGDFREVQIKSSGHVNNEPRYSVLFKGKKRLVIHSFLKGSVADSLEAWLRVWLG